MLTGLTACNTTEEGIENPGHESYEPLGYYSNEGHGGEQGDQRDGPITEMYDHTIGNEAEAIQKDKRNFLKVRDQYGNPQNPSVPLADQDRNFFARDTDASHGDANYHGHLDDNTREARNSYYTAYEGELAEQINDVTASVPNVEDVRSVSYGTSVLIAIELDNHEKETVTKEQVRKVVEPYLHGRSVQVVVDEGTFSRVRNIDNDLRDGGPQRGIKLDIHDLFKSADELDR